MSFRLKSPVLIFSLVAIAAALVVLAVLVLRSDPASAVPESAVQSNDLAVLKPVSGSARADLPEDAGVWLDGLESGAFGQLAGREVSSLGTADGPEASEFTLAGIGPFVCLYESRDADEVSVSGCAELIHVMNGDAFMVAPGCTSHRVVGFMPDGISSLNIEPASGTAKAVPVVSNVYVATLEPVETVLSGETESGEEISVTLPLARTPKNCF